MKDFADVISELRNRISELERRGQNAQRDGTIYAVDAVRGLARVKLLDGDNPFVTGWIDWSEAASGDNKTHNPPSIGQAVIIQSESGDLTDAIIQMSVPSSSHPRPSNLGDEYILTSVGDACVKVVDGGSNIRLSVGGVSLVISADGVQITGGKVLHNGTDVGDSHKHSNVAPGRMQTGKPV